MLALTERPSHCRGSKRVSGSSNTVDEWQQEKVGLLDTIQLLKDLLSKALNKFDEVSLSSYCDKLYQSPTWSKAWEYFALSPIT